MKRHEIRVFPKEQTVCRGPEEGCIRKEMEPELVGPSGGSLSRTVRKSKWKAWLQSRAVGGGVWSGAARWSMMVLTRETSGDINNRWLWRLEACNSSLGQQGPQVGSLPGLHSCDQSGLHIENLSQEKGKKKKKGDRP